MVRLVVEEPVAAGDQVGDRGVGGRLGIAVAGDLGAEVVADVVVDVPRQAVGAGGADALVGRQVLEGGDRRAGPVGVQDQLEAPARVGPVLEGDLHDLAERLAVDRSRVDPLDRLGDRLPLADRPEVGPGADDVAGLQPLLADRPEGLDVALLVLRPRRLGEVDEAAGPDQREPEVMPGLQQEGVEQRSAVAAGLGQGDQAVEGGGRALASSGPSRSRRRAPGRRRRRPGSWSWRSARSLGGRGGTVRAVSSRPDVDRPIVPRAARPKQGRHPAGFTRRAIRRSVPSGSRRCPRRSRRRRRGRPPRGRGGRPTGCP